MTQDNSESKMKKRNGSWTHDEHQTFMNCLLTFGKNWAQFVSLIPTRNGTQIRSHAQKFFNRLQSKFENTSILNLQSQIVNTTIQEQKQYQIFQTIVKPNLFKKKQKSQQQISSTSPFEVCLQSSLNNKTHFASQQVIPKHFFTSLNQIPIFVFCPIVKNKSTQSYFVQHVLKNRCIKQVGNITKFLFPNIEFIKTQIQNLEQNQQNVKTNQVYILQTKIQNSKNQQQMLTNSITQERESN